MTDRRSLAELRDIGDPAWPALRQDVEQAAVDVRVLAPEGARGEETLERLQSQRVRRSVRSR